MGAFIEGGGGGGNLLQNAGGWLGGQTNGLAKSFTPQNGYNVGVGQTTQQIQTNQQALAAALLAQSQGQGPNPAQAALNQATNKNIQQSTGMIASQKGINPALATRLAAENQGKQSQEAAGQGALMQAQQQLGAQNQLGTVYAQEQQGTNAANNINAGVAGDNTKAVQATSGGLLGGAGQALSMMNKGGAVKTPPHLSIVRDIYHPAPKTEMLKSNGGNVPGKAKVQGDSPKNDIVKTALSPGELVLPRSVMNSKDPIKNAAAFVADAIKRGGSHPKNPSRDFKESLKKAISERKSS